MSPEETSRRLSARWQQLCAQFLPISPERSMWRYSRSVFGKTPDQGWKLHISATILNADKILAKVAPLLITSGVQFKAPATLQDVYQLNSGVHHSYTQIGKIITVYPHDDEQAVQLARRLHESTKRFAAPSVPFDHRYLHKSNVYYRYGAFRSIEMEDPVHGNVLAIRDPDGKLTPDLYLPSASVPGWPRDPFISKRSHYQNRQPLEIPNNPLKNSFKVFRALSQRGKGGVYQAIDISVDPPRLCLVKEGRKSGEVWWDGRDGRSRLEQERVALTTLHRLGVTVPEVYSTFTLEGNFYLVTEYVEGENLLSYLKKRKRRLAILSILSLATTLSRFLSQLHAVGWVWGDCKPSNLILTDKSELRTFDFESAHPVYEATPSNWITPGFVPLHVPKKERSALATDIYAVGVVIFFLLVGSMPTAAVTAKKMGQLRPHVPLRVREIVCSLLNATEKGPDAQSLTDELLNIQLSL